SSQEETGKAQTSSKEKEIVLFFLHAEKQITPIYVGVVCFYYNAEPFDVRTHYHRQNYHVTLKTDVAFFTMFFRVRFL
ncbi:MAG: hypothetical protein AAB855_00395, partial [Patescibacteria group bacterium]